MLTTFSLPRVLVSGYLFASVFVCSHCLDALQSNSTLYLCVIIYAALLFRYDNHSRPLLSVVLSCCWNKRIDDLVFQTFTISSFICAYMCLYLHAKTKKFEFIVGWISIWRCFSLYTREFHPFTPTFIKKKGISSISKGIEGFSFNRNGFLTRRSKEQNEFLKHLFF